MENFSFINTVSPDKQIDAIKPETRKWKFVMLVLMIILQLLEF
jgi:hypothetical protein